MALQDEHIGYGIEVEFCADENSDVINDINLELPHWAVKNDSSIETDNYDDDEGWEVVSPILFGEDGIKQIKHLYRILYRQDAYQNETCGTHFHFDYRHILKCADKPFPESPEKIMFAQNIVFTSNLMEKYFRNNMPVSRNDNYYCERFTTKTLQSWADKEIDTTVNYYSKFNISDIIWSSEICDMKYQTFNIRNMIFRNKDTINYINYDNCDSIPGKIPTIEFRRFGHCLDTEQTIEWLEFAQNFLIKCASPNYNAYGLYHKHPDIEITHMGNEEQIDKFFSTENIFPDQN